MPLNVVLLEPEIPPNTGNIARTCAATGTKLHLIKPIGFSLEDRYLRRAGLDYWEYLELTVHESWEEFLRRSVQRPAPYPAGSPVAVEASSMTAAESSSMASGPTADTYRRPATLASANPVMYFFSRKGSQSYTEVEYPDGAYLVFGRESVGLPAVLLEANRDRCIRIPIRPEIRSLNLSNAVAIVVYEALNRLGFPGLTW